jgi:hypothetical protein
MSHDQQVQQKRETSSESQSAETSSTPAKSRVQFTSKGAIPPVGAAFQAKSAGPSASEEAFDQEDAEDQTHSIAAHGVSGDGGELPHKDAIAASFGDDHADTVNGISAHVGGAAGEATGALGAQAYASGNSVAFGQSPDMHTAAHEAAHVVQQKGGVQLKGGVGKAGDSYEQHADAVADRVVQGKSAADLLAPYSSGKKGGGAVQSKPLQFLGHELGKKLPEGAEKPKYGEDPDQRRYSREQYEKMWEKEQGKKLTGGMKDTIKRGCIGLTANNVAGGGNPLDYAEATYGTFEQAHKIMLEKNKKIEETRATNPSAAPDGEYILFAQLFWSNQKDSDNSKPDPKAYKPDPKTGKVDMSGYKYRARPGYVNFDYGWWDESSQSFWHANHMEYRDKDKAKKDPMKVYQSTKDHFIAGYLDFDRIVFGIALAKNYDPGKAAITHANH